MTSFIKSGSILPREPSQGEPLATAVTVGPNRMDGGEDAVLPPNLMEKYKPWEELCWKSVVAPSMMRLKPNGAERIELNFVPRYSSEA